MLQSQQMRVDPVTSKEQRQANAFLLSPQTSLYLGRHWEVLLAHGEALATFVNLSK